ncbi:alkylhydroperoxidase/carboxymuconolactone decarboxylase family protein YurZ [Saccharopolyspora phatthalungensis]|uniref:Alkylhydroperoxidase/carboxymuconolactone decarboxylase family protein YurZ n=1 Tax=Saccharopolyspora phatthalungensis TaxID=664693 RepID=A0A840QKF4_9PSEU|nr:alkylhydroperoxidase/carboxymuconolactone decarboxylase family protein YurZ [Saccharopolyspora phatthalungensis]
MISQDHETKYLDLMGADYTDAHAALEQEVEDFSTLSPQTRELVLIATYSAITLFDRDSVRHHVARALDLGVEPSAIRAAFVVGAIGSHSMTEVVPVLVDEMATEGYHGELDSDPDAADELRAWVQATRDFYSPVWDGVVAMHPAYVRRYQKLMSVPLGVDAKIQELLIIAVDAATTHLNVSGARVHIRKALRIGVSPRDILSVIELVSLVGYRSAHMGTDVLGQELERRAVQH